MKTYLDRNSGIGIVRGGESISPILPESTLTENFALECNPQTWINKNKNNYQWYYGTYPELLESGITLPVSMEALQLFYVDDMNERNLVPQDAWLNCYTALWSYLLGRLTDQINVKGRNWWQLTKANLPGAINKTFNDISTAVASPFGIPLWLWLGMSMVLLFGFRR